jgi:CSLREA domain-containing protein
MHSIHFLTCALTVAAVLLVLSGVVPAAAATFTVNRTLDAVDARPGDGVCETAPGNRICTLRAAIQESNARPGADTINLPAGTYTLTLQVAGHEDLAVNGDLDITDALSVVGAGASGTIITIGDPGPPLELERIFDIHGPITVTIRGVTLLRGGRRDGVGAGAGILNRGGTLAVELEARSSFSRSLGNHIVVGVRARWSLPGAMFREVAGEQRHFPTRIR